LTDLRGKARRRKEKLLMKEESILFECGALTLEGILNGGDGEKGVVVTHPHPLYGGDMHNTVVSTVVGAYSDAGYATLRFNFRGVGRSEGRYDDGRGEQDDVKGALDYLAGLGKENLGLAGYSFGAWVIGRGLSRYETVDHVVMVSPPIAFMDFSFLGRHDRIKLVVSGSQDDIAPPTEIRKMIGQWNPDASFRIIEGADHFYRGYETKLSGTIKGFLMQKP
jgi:uncharacterized protein